MGESRNHANCVMRITAIVQLFPAAFPWCRIGEKNMLLKTVAVLAITLFFV
jgi:hypothetical protein